MPTEADVENQVELLRSRNSSVAHDALKSLLETSASSDAVYAHMDVFIGMLDGESSYARNRALALVAANAKWDEAGRVDGCLDEYLGHLEDEKPITARQCVKGAVEIAKAKADLKPRIVEALRYADVSGYPDSMRPLIQADIREALLELEA